MMRARPKFLPRAVAALVNAFRELGLRKALEPAGGTRMKGSSHPKRNHAGFQAKRHRLRKLQRQARRITRNAG